MNGNGTLLFLVVWPMAAAVLAYIIGRFSKRGRDFFADGSVILELVVILALLVSGISSQDGGARTVSGFAASEFLWEGFCGLGLHLELDGFRALYGLIAAFMWVMTTVFSREYLAHYRNRNRYYLFVLLTLGATMGVFLAADLFTAFIFFEMMSFTSYVWVAHEEKEAALKAAETYLGVAVIGGMVTLMGLFLLYHTVGTLELSRLLSACGEVGGTKGATLYLAGGLTVFGFAAKAGVFPLHIWLPKAHPVAPAPASALLSGILTKTGIFGLLAVSCNIFRYDPLWGMAVFAFGVFTMFGGALLAVFSVDLKRTLACSSMSQIGFILVGIGMQGLLGEENALAVRGTLLHMVNHSLIKLVLFMAAGVVYMNLHKLNLNEIRGFGRKKPLLAFCFLMGALGIGGIPLWNGYISKTLLHESIVEYGLLASEGLAAYGTAAFWKGAEWIFLLSGGMTVAYMTKLFVALFVEKNPKRQEEFDRKYQHYWNMESKIAVAGSALLLPIMGILPGPVMDRAAELGEGFFGGGSLAHPVRYFSLENLSGGLISIAIGALIYFGVIRTVLMKRGESGVREYVDRWPVWLDLENLLYRPVLLQLFVTVSAVACRCLDRAVDGTVVAARKTTHRQLKEDKIHMSRNRLAYAAGCFLEWGSELLDKTVRRKHPANHSYVRRLMEFEEKTVRTNRIINQSLSFALLLVCIGLIVVLLYLLWIR
ncbi:MAG: NADH dehydrogenase [Lachnospiraceae bacterium]|jgi:formate hydrogenlyase subunit 3/multisubunit Na+/H+ antiporter MnhD subunit|nr:NADH dehydrogenase [Lachnospiraceae bacterium]